jgi:hypothetical protein
MSHKEEVIANRLSIIFGGPKGGPCGCMGVPPCTNIACSIWWEIVMQDEEIKARAFKFYDDNREAINSGILKILAKRFLIEE